MKKREKKPHELGKVCYFIGEKIPLEGIAIIGQTNADDHYEAFLKVINGEAAMGYGVSIETGHRYFIRNCRDEVLLEFVGK